MDLSLPEAGIEFIQQVISRNKIPPFLPKPKGVLRVSTFNVHFGERPEVLAKTIKQNKNLAQSDILLFQELEELDSERVSRSTKIARALKADFFYIPARALESKKGTHGLAVFSRLPFAKAESVPLPYINLPLRHRPRVALKVELEAPTAKLLVYNVHLDTTINHKERVGQVEAVLEHLKKTGENGPVILAGDFNTIPLFLLGRAIPIFYSNQKKKLHAFLRKQGFQTKCQRSGHTHRSGGLIRFQLDGIFTKNCSVMQYGVERGVKISDHFPLWADIKIN